MLDRICLILAALLAFAMAGLLVTMNTANAVGPYFVAGIATLFALLAIRVAIKYT